MARATTIAKPAATVLAHSGAGNRNHSAIAAHAPEGAMTRADKQTAKIAEEMRLALMPPVFARRAAPARPAC